MASLGAGGFELSKEHEEFRAVVREFAREQVAPYAARWDREHYFPVELVPQMGDLGLFGLVVPEEYGGAGGDFTSLCVAIEELGRVDQSVGITLSAGVGLGINPILTFGTEEQKQRWLPDLVAGRALAAFGLTESEAGSDAGATRTNRDDRKSYFASDPFPNSDSNSLARLRATRLSAEAPPRYRSSLRPSK